MNQTKNKNNDSCMFVLNEFCNTKYCDFCYDGIEDELHVLTSR